MPNNNLLITFCLSTGDCDRKLEPFTCTTHSTCCRFAYVVEQGSKKHENLLLQLRQIANKDKEVKLLEQIARDVAELKKIQKAKQPKSR